MQKKLSLVILVTLFALSNSYCAIAQILGEHDYWKKNIVKCIGSESSITFTQKDDERLEYLGTEFISISYNDKTVFITGMKDGDITCDSWWDLSDAKVSSAIIKLADLMESESDSFIDDVNILVDFTDGRFLVYSGKWQLTDAQYHSISDSLTSDQIFDIVLDYMN